MWNITIQRILLPGSPPFCGCLRVDSAVHVESSCGVVALSVGETVGPWHGLGSELGQDFLVTSSSGVFESARRFHCHDRGAVVA